VNPLELLRNAPLFQQPPLAIAINVVVYICFLLIAFSVVADFAAYHRGPAVHFDCNSAQRRGRDSA